jgi:hypothetical protein
MFTELQERQLSERGISLEQARSQIMVFCRGISAVRLIRPAIPDDGIEVFSENSIDHYIELFKTEKYNYSCLKFVPASGAASRMFKQLFEAQSMLVSDPYNIQNFLDKSPEISAFFAEIESYPFYNDLLEVFNLHKLDYESSKKPSNFAEILNLLLSKEGLSYGELPKGLLKFHKYPEEERTAFEEHFVEGAMYLKDDNDSVNLHFTVSPEHKGLFEDLAEKLMLKYSQLLKATFNVGFSVQKPSTDTIAVDMNNEPFLLENGELLFRPGGHGALLDNLQDLTAGIIFVGNIDNVGPDRAKPVRLRYKELLGGILIERVEAIHGFLRSMDVGLNTHLKSEIEQFIDKYISHDIAIKFSKLPDNEFNYEVRNLLNRPVRICGMVKNVGEPGGGPFWIEDSAGKISKQIIESSQVDLNDKNQEEIFSKASHFNPVDLACFIYNYKKEKFSLSDFRDDNMAFIALKSQGGRSLKALELPGLWNGSMAGWLTFFADVPVGTFSPVKTVFDLRRPEHLA